LNAGFPGANFGVNPDETFSFGYGIALADAPQVSIRLRDFLFSSATRSRWARYDAQANSFTIQSNKARGVIQAAEVDDPAVVKSVEILGQEGQISLTILAVGSVPIRFRGLLAPAEIINRQIADAAIPLQELQTSDSSLPARLTSATFVPRDYGKDPALRATADKLMKLLCPDAATSQP
jgi:hypothetical protein